MAKYLKTIEAWIGNAASMGGRLTLLDSVVTQISLYHMSMWLMSKTFVEKLDKHRRKFFWQGCNKKNRYYLVKWRRVYRSKDKGGLGVKDLRKQNISLMVKWWWKLETQTRVWQDLVRARYLSNKSVSTVTPRQSDSPCWKALPKIRELYTVGRRIKLGRGDLTRVWKDSINGLPPLNLKFPQLFEICTDQDCVVEKVGKVNASTFFRRRLCPNLSSQWDDMRRHIMGLKTTAEKDVVY